LTDAFIDLHPENWQISEDKRHHFALNLQRRRNQRPFPSSNSKAINCICRGPAVTRDCDLEPSRFLILFLAFTSSVCDNHDRHNDEKNRKNTNFVSAIEDPKFNHSEIVISVVVTFYSSVVDRQVYNTLLIVLCRYTEKREKKNVGMIERFFV